MASVTGLFDQLKLQQTNEEHVQVYETASKILKTSFDLSVLKTCLVALINLDNYALALKVLDTYPSAKTDLILEKAYVYYKLNRLDSCAELLDQELSESDRGLLHLKAQFKYQQGQNEEALELYKKLIETADESELLDLSVNERAVITQLLLMNDTITGGAETNPISSDDSSSYDLLFNNSLIELNKGNIDTALETLYAAKLKCEEVTVSFDANERSTELFPILLQLSYTLFRKGNVQESEQLLNQLVEEINSFENDNKLTKLLILNNLYSIKLSAGQKINSNLIYSNLKFPQIINQVNLTIPQLQKLKSNEAVLSLSIGKANSKFLCSISEIDFEQSDDKVIAKSLFKLAKNSQDLKLNLLAIQYNNQVSNFDNSFILINKLVTEEALLKTPSLIAIQVYIYENLNKSVVAILDHFTSLIGKFDLTKKYNYNIYKEVSFKLLSVKQDEKSLEIAEQLYTVNPEDSLVAAVVKKEKSQLTPIEELVADIDTEELLSRGVEDPARSTGSSSKAKQHRVTKSKYKRHKKVPERLVGKTADPERWLPLKDRSYYKPKKGKKSTATQGGSADATTEVNITSAPAPTSNLQSSKGSKNTKKKGKKRH